MPPRKIDLLVMGSSRPQLITYTMNSFCRWVMDLADGVDFRILLHEDVIFRNQSDKTIEYANASGFLIVEHDPYVGLADAMTHMFSLIESPYLFYLQDDWEFERPIDIERVLWTMDKHPHINCVTFSHHRNVHPDVEFKSTEYDFDGQKLCSNNMWPFLPGVWRTDFIRDRWQNIRKIKPEAYFTSLLGTKELRLNSAYCYSNIGSYFYGAMGEYRWVRHIGGTWRMADWRRKNGDPTGEQHYDLITLSKNRAPWLPEIEARPVNPKSHLDEGFRCELKKYPKELVEKFIPKCG
jgi:hypothetical protein